MFNFLLDTERGARFAERADQACALHWTGEGAELLDPVDVLVRETYRQLPDWNKRGFIRQLTGETLLHKVYPAVLDNAFRKKGEALIAARRTFTRSINPTNGRTITYWDNKAGSPLLCPDDARDEANRLQRRVMPAFEKLEGEGYTFHSCVFTLPNGAPGKLRVTQRYLWKRFRAMLKKKRAGKLLFPQIKGALCTMESPLSRGGGWNVHLNVILVCDNWLDYQRLRGHWFHNVHMQRIRGGADAVRAALRELIKYSVRAVPEKSLAKAALGERAPALAGLPLGVDFGAKNPPAASPPSTMAPGGFLDEGGGGVTAPPGQVGGEGAQDHCHSVSRPWDTAPALIEWPPDRIAEFIYAHRGFRRTRGYGVLHGLEDRPAEDASVGFTSVLVGSWVAGEGYRLQAPLLDLIPGDKSTTGGASEALARHFRQLAEARAGPGGVAAYRENVRRLEQWPEFFLRKVVH